MFLKRAGLQCYWQDVGGLIKLVEFRFYGLVPSMSRVSGESTAKAGFYKEALAMTQALGFRV